MRVKSIQVVNYKCFEDTDSVPLDPKWNVVVGQNNAGKTSLMECFRFLNFQSKPHKSAKFPEDYTYPEDSFVRANVILEGREHLSLLRRLYPIFRIPVPPRSINVASEVTEFLIKYFSRDEQEFDFSSRGGNGIGHTEYPAHKMFKTDGSNFSAVVRIDEQLDWSGGGLENNGNDDIIDVIRTSIRERVYVFNAERYSVGDCAVSETTALAPNAVNLAAVLMQLSSRRIAYEKFNSNVNAVFPNIHWVGAQLIANNRVELRIHTTSPDKDREDLGVSLSECGTGVGQVLAILYVAMTQPPGVIAIDEPNSFLHPGAAKKLIQILKRYDQHQYVVSTHSPEVISAAQPATLHLITSNGQESAIESFNETKVDTVRAMLEEVGASLSDAFGAENVVWVEGPTERQCFDLIVAERLGGPIVGLSFLSLRNTGDFERKGADHNAVFDIYETLSTGGAILPVTLAFSFDGEQRSEKDAAELRKRCMGKARILPRRMTENYLLHAEAIAVALGELETDEVAVNDIAALLEEHGSTHLPRGVVATFGSEEFLKRVDAARLLEDVFHHASGGQQEYRKTRDAVAILRIILRIDAQFVDELAGYVGDLIRTERPPG